MKKTFNYLAITSCLVLGTALAHADSGASYEKMHEQKFKSMDGNADGKVTKDEFIAFQEKKFKDMDTNSDSQLSSDEMKAEYKKMDSGHKGK